MNRALIFRVLEEREREVDRQISRQKQAEGEIEKVRRSNSKREREAMTESGGNIQNAGGKEETATTSTFYSQQMHPCRGWRNSQDTMLPPNDASYTSHRRRRRFPRLSRPAKTTSNSTLTNDSASPMLRSDFRRAVSLAYLPERQHTFSELGRSRNKCTDGYRWTNWNFDRSSPALKVTELKTGVSRTHTKNLARCKIPKRRSENGRRPHGTGKESEITCYESQFVKMQDAHLGSAC